MVTPLAVTALLWDKRRERATRLFTERTIGLRLGRWRRQLALGTALSGALMIVMGVLAMVLAFTGAGMPSGGWQTSLSAWLQHVSTSALHALSWIPGWVLLPVLMAGLSLLIRRALRRPTPRTPPEPPLPRSDDQDTPVTPPSADIPQGDPR